MRKAPPNDAIPKRQRWSLGDYVLSAVTCGPQSGETVVFLHGLPTSAELWRPMQYHFGQQGYHTLAPDLPGFGKTTCASPANASWRKALQLIERWLRGQPHIQRIWWIGHQAGCLMAAQCAQAFSTNTTRVTFIQPPMQAADLWPNWALSWMPTSVRWGLYDKITRAHLFPNLVQRQQLAMTLAHVKRLDAYLDRKVLFNEKVKDPQRRQEFAHYLQHLPNPIDTQVTEQALALKCPVQIIMPPTATPSLWAQLWRALRRKPNESAVQRENRLNAYRQAGCEVISIRSGQLFSPIEKPQEIAEAAMVWAQPTLRDVLAERARAEAAKPSPVLQLPKHDGIKIPALLAIPPDTKPEEGPPPLALPEHTAAPANN